MKLRRIKLFIAMSLDGYIADVDGNINFLNNLPQAEPDHTYENFIKEIDTVILGSTTYLQIINELSPNDYPYKNMTSYVLTSQKNLLAKEKVTFINQEVTSLISELKEQEGDDIWLVGGSSIINPLITADLIDDYYISIAPVLLGEGISLFTEKKQLTNLHLVRQVTLNSMIHTHYQK